MLKHDCKAELKTADLKVTPARLAVLNLLEIADVPLGVGVISNYLAQKNIKVDPATVFRIINLFTNRGIVKQIHLNEDKFRYELSSKIDHHHLICENCGAIEDVSDCNISALEKDIRKKKGFITKSHSLEFFGVCIKCQR